MLILFMKNQFEMEFARKFYLLLHILKNATSALFSSFQT